MGVSKRKGCPQKSWTLIGFSIINHPFWGTPWYPYFLETPICATVKSRYIGDGHPTLNRNPYNGYINPYYWVDDHPLLYGNTGSLDPGTYEKKLCHVAIHQSLQGIPEWSYPGELLRLCSFLSLTAPWNECCVSFLFGCLVLGHRVQ